jgi:hypothetical protein
MTYAGKGTSTERKKSPGFRAAVRAAVEENPHTRHVAFRRRG